MKSEYNNINNLLTDNDKKLVKEAVKILLKSFELVFQVQQMIKVSNERSLMTDIIQNMIVDYLKCLIVDIRMNAIRALTPYLMVNNLNAAKFHINTIFFEISSPMTDMHLMLQILFELFLTYGLKSFDISDDIDADLICDDDFTGENILPLLADSVDFEIDDSSYKTVIVESFCNLIVFQEFKSIYVISKFLIIWFKGLTSETFNVYQTLMKFFTTYMFHIPSSSSTIAKCYVPVLKQIAKHKLINKLSIDLNEMNTTLLNLCQGTIFRDENKQLMLIVNWLCIKDGKTNIKKLRQKFSSILLKEKSEDHGNLFSKENIKYISLIYNEDDDNDDDEDEENEHQYRNLSSMKCMSEDIKKSFNMKNQEQSSSLNE
ncbi:Armadillo-like helical,Nuclear condensin complex subunit 3, C-terminal domain [Cinara cedri]|uniref:Armadillo-like helical,Nuclear condensin complex subunit 3, C-terminal domain n=1 Tax=Cinara cedri TaxID=506608 RepID=A0A5E4MHQ5_9HEMI|nr:Armadillo-like helical,Nuclear condensin complex subunit 3, C-terminal domain [Cinara cedri]